MSLSYEGVLTCCVRCDTGVRHSRASTGARCTFKNPPLPSKNFNIWYPVYLPHKIWHSISCLESRDFSHFLSFSFFLLFLSRLIRREHVSWASETDARPIRREHVSWASETDARPIHHSSTLRVTLGIIDLTEDRTKLTETEIEVFQSLVRSRVLTTQIFSG